MTMALQGILKELKRGGSRRHPMAHDG